MKALVVGGTGFIGSHIVDYLIQRGIEVRVLFRRKRNVSHLNERRIEFVYGNVLNASSLKQCTANVDLVYSAFGILGHWGVPEKVYWDVNVKGVRNLLESCVNCNIKQLIHISSAGVLGPIPDGVIADESFPFNPSNVYERTKCHAEKEILRYGKTQGIPFTIIRPEFAYGSRDMHVLRLFKAIKTGRFFLLGNGQSYLHPTYIDDLVQAVGLCTANRNAVGNTFLIAGERPYTVQELATIMAGELEVRLPDVKIPLVLANAAARVLECGARVSKFEPVLTTSSVKFFSENRAFSCQKARTELGFVPEVDFREGVRRTVRWYLDNRYL